MLRLERHNVSLMRALAREEECRYVCTRAPPRAWRRAARHDVLSPAHWRSARLTGAASDVRRHELEQILWHCDTADKASETPRMHNVLVNSKVQILEDRNRSLKHELERTQMLEEAARRKLAEGMGQNMTAPFSYHGLVAGSSKRAEADT